MNALRLEQKNITEQERTQAVAEFESYLELAIVNIQQMTPKLIIMRGLSASGKSTVSQQLLDAMGLIRIRSDVERKRLFSIASSNHAANEVGQGIYSVHASQQLYAKLLELASQVIGAGYSAIIDAVFLEHERRQPFQQLAESLNVAYFILEVMAPPAVLRQRIVERKNDVSDADLAVLEHQLLHWMPLHEDETNAAISVNTQEAPRVDSLIKAIRASGSI